MSFWTDRSCQTVQTQIRLLLLGAVWSSSTLFAIPSASFGCMTLIIAEPHCLNFRISTAIFRVSKFLGVLLYIFYKVLLCSSLSHSIKLLFVVVCSSLISFSTIFQSYHDGVWLRQELNAHFYEVSCQTLDDTTTSHIILTLGQSVYPVNLSAKRRVASTIFNDFGISWPGIEPVTSRS